MTLRALSLLACGILAGPVFGAQLKYTVKIKGEKVGTFVDETTGDETNGYSDESTLTLTQEEHKLTVHEITRYGKDGMDSSRTVELTADDHLVKTRATLGDDGAKLTIWDGDDKSEKDIPLATKTTRADPTNFWWKGVVPDSGTSITYQSFNMEETKWSDVTLKFVGKSKVKLGDTEIEANEVDRTEGEDVSKVWVDDKGDALVVEDGEMRIERDQAVG